MEIQPEQTDMYGDYLLINYVKLVKNSNELCIVCQVDETEDGKQFNRYQLVCKHIAHTRCLRRWCSMKDSLNCPYCSHIKRQKKNRYCEECDTFGHAFGDGNCRYQSCPFPKQNFGCVYTRLMKLCLKSR